MLKPNTYSGGRGLQVATAEPTVKGVTGVDTKPEPIHLPDNVLWVENEACHWLSIDCGLY
jgi:hypothetical protein